MEIDVLMGEVQKLHERFLQADEATDEIPLHEKEHENEEIIVMSELVFNAAQSAFEIIRMLKKSGHKDSLQSFLKPEGIAAIDAFQEACEQVQETLGEALYSEDSPEEEELTASDQEESSEEDASEEKSSSEEPSKEASSEEESSEEQEEKKK